MKELSNWANGFKNRAKINGNGSARTKVIFQVVALDKKKNIVQVGYTTEQENIERMIARMEKHKDTYELKVISYRKTKKN